MTVVLLVLLVLIPIRLIDSQSIIYSMTRLNKNGVLENINETSVLYSFNDGDSQDVYMRGKRTMQKMSKYPTIEQQNSTHLDDADEKRARQNISQVLFNLLQNYDANQRPGYGGPPAVITSNLEIRSMGPISELDMEYSLDCYFRQVWEDERLRFTANASFLSLNIKMLDKIWKPDTYFHTGKGSHLHMITMPNKFLRIKSSGSILYSMRLTIKSLCPMDLHGFPMDKQSCPLIYGSYGYTNDHLIYKWDDKPVTFSQKDFTLSSFDIVKTIHRNDTFYFKRGNHSMLQVNFNLRRHVGYFLINQYLPCCLIVILSWVSFWINREATADRAGLGATAVLTLSTFGLDSRSDLPRVSYATALDWYTVMCFLFVAFTLLEFAAVHYFTKFGTGEVPFIELDSDDTDDSDEDGDNYDDDANGHRLRESKQTQLGSSRFNQTKLTNQVGQRNCNSFKATPAFYSQADYFSEDDDYGFKPNIPDKRAALMNCEYHGFGTATEMDSYHMPHCAKNDDFVPWQGDDYFPASQFINNNDYDHRTQLENYVLKRLLRSSHTIYPHASNDDQFDENIAGSLKLASSWPSLAWNDYSQLNQFAHGQYEPNNVKASVLRDMERSVNKENIESRESSNGVLSCLKSTIYALAHCCLQFWYCFTANEAYKLEMKRRRGKAIGMVNSVSLIDKVSRILFPVVFFVLNLSYWTFYISERNTDFKQWE